MWEGSGGDPERWVGLWPIGDILCPIQRHSNPIKKTVMLQERTLTGCQFEPSGPDDPEGLSSFYDPHTPGTGKYHQRMLKDVKLE